MFSNFVPLGLIANAHQFEVARGCGRGANSRCGQSHSEQIQEKDFNNPSNENSTSLCSMMEKEYLPKLRSDKDVVNNIINISNQRSIL